MKVELATAEFDDGSEDLCIVHRDDDGGATVLDVDAFRALAMLQEHDLDAYDVVMSTVHAFLERQLEIGLEA